MSDQDGLSLLAHCPHCLQTYRRMDVKLVSKRGNTVQYHISCVACHRALMLKVSTKGGGLSCSGVLTDCSFADALQFKDSQIISVDDVLSAHLALQLDNFIEIR